LRLAVLVLSERESVIPPGYRLALNACVLCLASAPSTYVAASQARRV